MLKIFLNHHFSSKIFHFILTLLFVTTLITIAQNQQQFSRLQQCIQYSKNVCIRCPINCHIFSGQCYQNIYGCIQYKHSQITAICTKCNLTISTVYKNTSCQSINSSLQIQTLTSPIIDFIYKDSNIFRQLNSKDLSNDKYFQKCDSFMKNGQYRHFISRSGDPIYSVFTYSSKGFKQYKILYEGSGGNMLMCLIGINQNNIDNIILRSFVTIGRTQIVQNCVDYSVKLQCSRCKVNYHLDIDEFGEKICERNIQGCIGYFNNICIKCRGNQLLVENRCINNCRSMKDTRSIKYYGFSTIFKEKIASNILQRQYLIY